MSLILHLSDIHLAPVEKDRVFDDYKSEIVPLNERQQRSKLLENTLGALGRALKQANKKLDAIIITGDITVANDERGFKLLPKLIEKLKEAAPPNDRIVAVPGNHDVTWSTPPSSQERYAHFLQYVREQGYVTPLLDGVDFSADRDTSIQFFGHYLLGPNNAWLIVPINSANYSGSLEPISPVTEEEWEGLSAHLTSLPPDKAKELLRRVRLHDAARISFRQFAELDNLLQEVKRKVRADGGDYDKMVKIALLHHHLLPVSTSEEVKSFESITNLGLLRHFLNRQNFNVVLHGHKHTGYIYFDYIYDYQKRSNIAAHRVLVISGATIGGVDYREEEVCRLISLAADTHAPTLSVSSVPAVQQGITINLEELSPRSFPLWPQPKEGEGSPTDSGVKIICGETLDEVYARTMSLFSGLGPSTELYNIVCQVNNPKLALTIPDEYPNIGGVQADKRQQWFEDLIKWWQKQTSRLSHRSHFTHGNRIYAYSNSIDQFKRVTEVLANRDNSQRAVVALLNPETDEIHQRRRKFPAFCLVQFIIRSTPRGPYLDCIGYFRKQEFRYWMPVNIAELATLQSKLHGELKITHRGLELGTITSVAAIGYAGESVPRVVIPAIDRTLDDDPNKLWSMAYALFWRDMPQREELREEWEKFLTDLEPDEQFNQDGVPIALDGIDFLVHEINRFTNFHHTSRAETIAQNLKQLFECNDAFAVKISSGIISTTDYKQWKSSTQSLIADIRERVAALFSPPANGS
ncbi:MAG TPA: metallophosphoesterase [Pyrinomonadaceae bacterium]|nr:metallophosphoesterase [Pyrinomonadaceae bacterium]